MADQGVIRILFLYSFWQFIRGFSNDFKIPNHRIYRFIILPKSIIIVVSNIFLNPVHGSLNVFQIQHIVSRLTQCIVLVLKSGP